MGLTTRPRRLARQVPVATAVTTAGSSPGSEPRPRDRAAGRILSLAVALWLCMMPQRAMLVGYITLEPLRLPRRAELPELVLIGVYDFAYVAGITALALVALHFVGRRRSGRALILLAFILVAALSLLSSLANVELVPMLGRPFNYPWLYYSDFLVSFDALQAIRDALADEVVGVPRVAWYGLGSLGVLIASAWGIRLATRWAVPRFVEPRKLARVTLPLAGAYMVLGHLHLTRHQWPYAKLENPVVSFAVSVARAYDAPPLLTMRTDVDPGDFQTVAERGGPATGSGPDAAGIERVILFVLESVPVEYLGVYGSRLQATPRLDEYRDRAAIFGNIYAHAPSTNASLLSLLCSVYPLHSYEAVTAIQPDIPLPSLSGELQKRGWRTGFFYGADLGYQRSGEFLQSRGFDLVEDGAQRRCETRFESEEWKFLSGSDDECTVDSVIEWIGRRPGSRALAVAWTMATHFPYFTRGELLDYGVDDPYLEKYLNALRRSDAALGRLLHALEDRRWLDSTLVVVVGDHGEAFRQHGTYGHASGVYEENLHVPLILINPRLFHGEVIDTLGGLNDVAPTLMDLLRLPAPGGWQGRSLWAAERPGRVYFFAPWSDLLFGFREGQSKLIFNGSRNTFEVYDLGVDPRETHDLSAVSGDLIESGKQRLAAWVQYQARFYAPLIRDGAGR